MSGLMQVNVTKNSTAAEMLDALSELTVGRAKNGGTLKVVRENGEMTGLKCTRHHFYSRSIDSLEQVAVQDTVDFVGRTVNGILDEVSNKLMADADNQNLLGADELKAQIKEKILALRSMYATMVSKAVSNGYENRTVSLQPLSRDEIKSIVIQLKELRQFTVEDLVSCKDCREVIHRTVTNPLERRMSEIENAWNEVHQFGANAELDGRTRQRVLGNRIHDLVRNREYVDCATRLMKEQIEFVSSEVKTDSAECAGPDKFEDLFEERAGSSAKVLQQLRSERPDVKTAMLIFADQSHSAGTVTNSGQEEDMSRCCLPRALAALVGLGITRPEGVNSYINFVKNEVNLAKGSVVNGMLYPALLDNIDGKKLDKNLKDVLFATFASPTFAEQQHVNTDLTGDVGWLWKCRETIGTAKTDVSKLSAGEKKAMAKESANSEKFVNRLWELFFENSWLDNGEEHMWNPERDAQKIAKRGALLARAGLTEENARTELRKPGIEHSMIAEYGERRSRYHDMMMCTLFAADKLREVGVDIFSSDTDKNAEKLLKLIVSGNYRDILETANRNYVATLTRQVENLVISLEKRGVKQFIGGPAGCGFFGNDSKLVAKIYADVFSRHNVKFVFANRDGVKSKHIKIWKDAFRAAAVRRQCEVRLYGLGKIGSEGGLGGGLLLDEAGGTREFTIRAIKDANVTDLRGGYAFALNLCSRKLEALKDATPQEKANYQAFLGNAKEIIEKGDLAKIRERLQALQDTVKLNEKVWEGITSALDAAEGVPAMIVARKFPKMNGEARNCMLALEKQDPAHFGELVESLSRFKVNDVAILFQLLNRPDAAARKDMLDRLATLGFTTDLRLMWSVAAKQENLREAERQKGSPLTCAETLKILYPHAEPEIAKHAKLIGENPEKGAICVFEDSIQRLRDENFKNDPQAGVSFLITGQSLIARGVPAEDVVSILQGKAFNPMDWGQSCFLTTALTATKDDNAHVELLSVDLPRQMPTINVTTPSADPNEGTDTYTWKIRSKYENLVANRKDPARPDHRETEMEELAMRDLAREIVGRIHAFCGNNGAQELAVVLALTQNNDAEANIRGMKTKDNSGEKYYRIDVSCDSDTGDVTITKKSAPDARVSSTVKRVIHPDGSQEMLEITL